MRQVVKDEGFDGRDVRNNGPNGSDIEYIGFPFKTTLGKMWFYHRSSLESQKRKKPFDR
jgi:hypothetical protein